ncbi:MAG: hypothetical protein WC378_06670 [Opitutaceae bacterium]
MAEVSTVQRANVQGITFAERACYHFSIQQSQYEETVLWQCLYWKARFLRPLLQYFDRNFFAPDRDFVRRMAGIRRREDLLRELAEFFYHPRNNSWLRRRFKLRISCRRLVGLVREIMPKLDAPGSSDYGAPSASS